MSSFNSKIKTMIWNRLQSKVHWINVPFQHSINQQRLMTGCVIKHTWMTFIISMYTFIWFVCPLDKASDTLDERNTYKQSAWIITVSPLLILFLFKGADLLEHSLWQHCWYYSYLKGQIHLNTHCDSIAYIVYI